MKKVTALLLVVTMGLCVSAQTTTPLRIVTDENAVGYWNLRTSQFEFEPSVKSVIAFNFYPDYVAVEDRNHSVYRIVEQLPKKTDKDHTTVSASCLDERNRNCTVAFMSYTDGSSSIGIIYDDRMFLYIVQ